MKLNEYKFCFVRSVLHKCCMNPLFDIKKITHSYKSYKLYNRTLTDTMTYTSLKLKTTLYIMDQSFFIRNLQNIYIINVD